MDLPALVLLLLGAAGRRRHAANAAHMAFCTCCQLQLARSNVRHPNPCSTRHTAAQSGHHTPFAAGLHSCQDLDATPWMPPHSLQGLAPGALLGALNRVQVQAGVSCTAP